MKRLTHLLHLEDDAPDAELIQTTLESAGIVCQIKRVQNRDEFTQALQQGEFDLILADYRLPAYDGMSALQLAQELRPSVPFIFVSGTLGEDAAIDGLTQGATDYVLKQKLSRLVPAVERALRETENRRDRQQAEEALRESETRFRLLADHAPVLIWMAGTDTLCTFFNQPWLDFTGRTFEQELGNGRAADVHPDDVQRCLATYLAAFHARQPFRMEYRLRRADGVYRWIIDHGLPLFASSGLFTGYIGSCFDITEIKEAHAEVERLARHNELILTSAGEGILGLDKQGNHIFVNPAAAAMLGYEVPELIGQRSHSTWHHTKSDGTPYPEEACPIYAALQDGIVHRVTNEVFWRKDGASFPVEYVSTPLCEGDRLTGAVVVFSDITQRKESEMRSRKLTRAVEQSPVSIVITDLLGNIEYVNPRFTQITGYSFEEVVGQKTSLLKSGETPPDQYAELWATISAGGEWRGKFHNRKKSGELYWEDASISPILDADGQITHYLAVKEDVTARKRAEAEMARLYQAEQSQRQLAEALRDTAAQLNNTLNLDEVLDRVLDNVGRVVPHDGAHIILVEDGVAHLVRNRGLGHSTLEPRPAFLLPINDIPPLREMVATGQPLVIGDTRDYTGWEVMGSMMQLRAVLSVPILFKQQTLGFLILMSREPGFFTATHAARLQVFADQAAMAIENARLYLAERQQLDRWQQAQAVLAQAEKLAALGRLAAALAHEINNPLQAIQSHLELIMDFPLEADEQRQFLQVMRQEINRLSQLTRNVLNFARPAPEPRHPTSLDKLIQHTLTLAGKQLQHHHIEVTTNLQPTPPVLVSAEQMTQVFLNILLNAIEAIRQTGQIHISTRLESDGVVIRFANDGPAIPFEDLPHIFEPFYTTKPDGTGLGLSTTHRLIQQHNGTVSVENVTETRGVVFRITLPLMPVSEPLA